MHILVLAFLLLFGGCSVHQSAPTQSSVTLPKQYTQPQNLHVRNNWFEELNDTQLNALIEQALKHNRELKVARQNLKAVSALLKQTRSDQTLHVDATASASRILNNQTDDTNSFSLGLAASYEVDIWGRLDALERAGVYDFNASVQELQAAAVSISAEVALTWYRLLEQHQQRQLLNKQVDINEKYLKLLIARFNIANVKAADIIQQRQALVALQGEKERTDLRLAQYKTLLALLLGTDSTNLHVNLEQPFYEPSTPATLASANLLERPDVQAAFFNIQSENERLGAAISNTYPRLSLNAALSTASTTLSDLFHDWIASLAANLTAPLLDGGRRDAEVQQQEAYAKAALYAYEQTLLNALKEVEDAQSSLLHQQAYLKSIESQLTLSKASMQRIREQYIHGNGDFLRLLSAQLNYETLQRTYLQARRERIEADIALHRCVASKIETQSFYGEFE